MARITDINHLLFKVELHPIFTELEINGKQAKIEVPNNKIVVNSKSGKPLGVVSNTYKLITNHEALELGKKCAVELFGTAEADNIEIFNVDAPSTASYCHIDLVHKGHIMNLWDEEKQSDVYVPYIRVTNSYNTTRALRFDIGFCKKICLNGVIFETETISFTFSHIKHELNGDISFALEQGKLKAIFEKFKTYANRLKEFKVTTDYSMRLIKILFGIKSESEIDFNDKKEDRTEYKSLTENIEGKIEKYTKELGETGYSLFNVITDIASHPMDNRYFRRDRNAMQRLAGNWINSFQEELKKLNFDPEEYLKHLAESPNKALHLTNDRYAASGS